MDNPGLLNNFWVAGSAAIVLYAVNYYLAFYAARAYRAGANPLEVEGMFEWKNAFHEDPGRRLYFSPRLAWTLLFLAIGVVGVWWVTVQQNRLPGVFNFLMGGVILLEAIDGLRHFRALVLFTLLAREGGIQGSAQVSHRLALKLLFFELYGATAFLGLLFALTLNWFFLGGALACFVQARRQRDWALAAA